jgi:hypothetical protein
LKSRTILAILATAALLAGGVALAPVGAASHGDPATSVMHVQLHPLAFSGVVGSATLTYNPGANTTTVKVSVHNLEPGSVHPEHIHAGKCSTNGPVLAALGSIKADARGTGTVTSVITGSFMRKQAYINLHMGPGVTLTQYTVLACGELGKTK